MRNQINKANYIEPLSHWRVTSYQTIGAGALFFNAATNFTIGQTFEVVSLNLSAWLVDNATSQTYTDWAMLWAFVNTGSAIDYFNNPIQGAFVNAGGNTMTTDVSTLQYWELNFSLPAIRIQFEPGEFIMRAGSTYSIPTKMQIAAVKANAVNINWQADFAIRSRPFG